MHKIKRYANRKLYDTKSKQYITLDKIAKLLKAGEEVSVLDNKTGEDITAATVSQILARAKQGQSDNGASNVMIQLLRKGPGTLVDYGKRYLSLWDRALTMADEEIDRLVERLVKEKEITPSEGSRLKKDMVNRAEDLKKWISEKTDQRINEALDLMNLASREQVTKLTEKIDTLTRKVQSLEKKLARKAKDDIARKEAERLAAEARLNVIPSPKDDLKPEKLPESQGSETLGTLETGDLSA
ncbi:MAG TPA: polyhydroxyalkanoate synthesis regulator DNA-binding domain-containing protein [Desulfobacteria bacterium]|nr:polyhydroxyalkanoate synthesis regulator DNA-binding domain-containing protein [Desulfobacteria bacterium]